MEVIMDLVIAECVVCGVSTDWDNELGAKVLCAECWDKEAEWSNRNVGATRKYQEAHKEEINEKCRVHREDNREAINKRGRELYRQNKGKDGETVKVKEKCPECGGELELVINQYVNRAVCKDCGSVFKVRIKLIRLYGIWMVDK